MAVSFMFFLMDPTLDSITVEYGDLAEFDVLQKLIEPNIKRMLQTNVNWNGRVNNMGCLWYRIVKKTRSDASRRILHIIGNIWKKTFSSTAENIVPNKNDALK